MNTNLYKSTETSITKNGVEMTLAEAASELQELSRVSYRLECDKINLTETAKQLEKERDDLKEHCANLSSAASMAVGALPNGSCISSVCVAAVRHYNGTSDQSISQSLAEHDAEVIRRARMHAGLKVDPDAPAEDYDLALLEHEKQLRQKAKESK
jgi:hypothetical protein